MNSLSVNVYGEVFDEIKVQSMHSPTTKYVIRCGNVSWSKNGNYKPVIYILINGV